MYSPQVTAQHIRETSKSLGRDLVLSSQEKVATYTAHFQSLLGEDKLPKRQLTREEQDWIANEQTLCTLDFRYWASRYGYIRDKGNRRVKFVPNTAQNIILDICGEMELARVAIMLQLLKARQLGMSTLFELIVAHRVQFHSHIDAVVASSDPDKSRKMTNMMLFCWSNQPWWLMPQRTKYKAGELIEYGELGSAVSIQWGNQTTGISRGATPTVAHLSELAEFEHPEELVDASLLRAMHDDPFVLLALESTASGRDNWWHKKWEYAKANHAKGMSRLRPVFLPWYVGTDLYPNRTWLRGHKVPRDYKPNQQVEDHAERAKEYVAANPMLRKYLGENWEMPIEQQWFYEVNRQEYAANGELNKWYQEMPADDLEAFQHRRMSIFGAELLAERRNSCQAPLVVLGLQGPESEIPLRLQPTEREIDRLSSFKPLVINANRVSARGTFRLVPLKWTGTSDMDPLGKIFLYAMPEKYNDYGLGVDTAFGVGQDRTVVQVVRKATPYADAEQCAEFATDQAGAFEIWPFVLGLATLFSTIPSGGGEVKQAKVVIEMAANGEATQAELWKRGWHGFPMQQKAQVRGQVPTNRTTPQFGWKTTEGTRGPMIDFLHKALVDGWIQINSPWLVDEMGNFVRNEKKERLEAASDSHDDRLMALGIVLYSLHRPELYRGETPSWMARIQAEADDKVFPVWTQGYHQSGVDPRGPEDFWIAPLEFEEFS